MSLHILVILYSMVLAMTGSMSRPNIILLLARGFVGLLWVGIDGVGIDINLDIGIDIMVYTGGLYLIYDSSILFWIIYINILGYCLGLVVF